MHHFIKKYFQNDDVIRFYLKGLKQILMHSCSLLGKIIYYFSFHKDAFHIYILFVYTYLPQYIIFNTTLQSYMRYSDRKSTYLG